MTGTYKTPQQFSSLPSTNSYQPFVQRSQYQPLIPNLNHQQSNHYQHQYSSNQHRNNNYQSLYGLSQPQLGYNYIPTPYGSKQTETSRNQYKPLYGYQTVPKYNQYQVTNLYQPYRTTNVNPNVQERFLH